MTITNWDTIQVANDETKQPIHLITQWYEEPNLRRRRELVAVLHMNVINNAVTHIHLLQPRGVKCTIEQDVKIDPNFPIAMLKSKLIIRRLDDSSTERLTFLQAIEYANNNILEGYAVLINLDDFFDQSLSLLSNGNKIDPKTVFFISRYEIDPTSTGIGNQCSRKYLGSHDALIFRTPIPLRIAYALPFEMGTWHIETKVIYEFIQGGYKVRNICKSLRIWHLHSSQVRHRLMPTKKYLPTKLYHRLLRFPETFEKEHIDQSEFEDISQPV